MKMNYIILWSLFGEVELVNKTACRQVQVELVTTGLSCVAEEEAVWRRRVSYHQLLLQSGAWWMFPQGRLWEAQLRLRPAPQIKAIPVLIRVLWLMFDEEGDRLSGCFYSCFLWDTFIKTRFFFLSRVGSQSSLVFFSLLHHCSALVFFSHGKLFSMFLPLRVVSTHDIKTFHNKAAVSCV